MPSVHCVLNIVVFLYEQYGSWACGVPWEVNTPVKQMWGPEFKSQCHQKKKLHKSMDLSFSCHHYLLSFFCVKIMDSFVFSIKPFANNIYVL
jgi:hypothetical protein